MCHYHLNWGCYITISLARTISFQLPPVSITKYFRNNRRARVSNPGLIRIEIKFYFISSLHILCICQIHDDMYMQALIHTVTHYCNEGTIHAYSNKVM